MDKQTITVKIKKIKMMRSMYTHAYCVPSEGLAYLPLDNFAQWCEDMEVPQEAIVDATEGNYAEFETLNRESWQTRYCLDCEPDSTF